MSKDRILIKIKGKRLLQVLQAVLQAVHQVVLLLEDVGYGQRQLINGNGRQQQPHQMQILQPQPRPRPRPTLVSIIIIKIVKDQVILDGLCYPMELMYGLNLNGHLPVTHRPIEVAATATAAGDYPILNQDQVTPVGWN